MPRTRKTSRPARLKPAAPSDTFALATAGAEMTLAALRVVNARTPMIARALSDPMRGDYAELTRMVSEKPLAFAKSAAAGGPGLLAMAAESNRYLTEAWRSPGLGLAPGLAASMNAMAFWGRMMSLGVAWQSAMLAPVHAEATANARRLAPKA
jgi:hypothetical protein